MGFLDDLRDFVNIPVKGFFDVFPKFSSPRIFNPPVKPQLKQINPNGNFERGTPIAQASQIGRSPSGAVPDEDFVLAKKSAPQSKPTNLLGNSLNFNDNVRAILGKQK